jgi:nucleotide-binding universal stress UspA family protein
MKILLAVDGSTEAYEAGQMLAHLSKPQEVILLHVLDIPTPDYPIMTPEASAELYQSILQSMREAGEQTLIHAASFLPPHIGRVEKHLETGSPTDTIISMAQKEHIDLILMGARGVGPMKELLLGSVSHRVLSHASCPVLVVKNPVRAVNRILVPLRGADDATAAVKFLSANPFKGTVDVTIFTAVNFAGPPWPADSSVKEAMKSKALEGANFYVDGVVSQLSPEIYRPKGLAVIGDPATMILREVAKTSPDLVLMGSRGRTGITRFVLGSVSHAVLHQATCPAIMFPWPGV